jgi:hypothetical protein
MKLVYDLERVKESMDGRDQKQKEELKRLT